MPIDPNSETSDVGQMYRQYLQSKGMPLTNENMQRVISQSQREPGMIAGLSVQQSPGQSAPTPPNVAGASQSSSGNPQGAPNATPTGMRPAMPIPPMPPAEQAAPPVQPTQAPVASTPPPGQAPAPAQTQVAPTLPDGTSLPQEGGGIGGLIAGLGGTAGVAALLSKFMRPPNSSTPTPAMSTPTPAPSTSPVAAAMEKAIPSGLPGHQPQPVVNSGNNPLDALNILPGVRPVGPEIQGPPMGPAAMQGPPPPVQGPMESPGNAVTADSIIENIMHPKMSVETPRVGNTVPAHAVRSSVRPPRVRIP